jgi:hypothetical protein
MFWVKIMFLYPLLALMLYMGSGQHMATMLLSIVMVFIMRLSVYFLTVLARKG